MKILNKLLKRILESRQKAAAREIAVLLQREYRGYSLDYLEHKIAKGELNEITR